MESLRGQEVEYCVPEGELTSAPQLQRRKPGANPAQTSRWLGSWSVLLGRQRA